MIQKQCVAIFDTHELANAISLRLLLYHGANVPSCRSQIFLVGRRQGVRRFVSPGLHYIKVSKQSLQDVHIERHASTSFGSILPSLAMILCHMHALRTSFYYNRCPRAARKWWRGVVVLEYGGGLDFAHAFERG